MVEPVLTLVAAPASLDGSHTQQTMTSSCHPTQEMRNRAHPPPPPPICMARRRISLVRLASGRHIWWMDSCASSKRAGVMTRGRMDYLEEKERKGLEEGSQGQTGQQPVAISSSRMMVMLRRRREYLAEEEKKKKKNAAMEIIEEGSLEDESGLYQQTSGPMTTDNAAPEQHHGGNQNDNKPSAGHDENMPHEISLETEESTTESAQLHCHRNIFPVVHLSFDSRDKNTYLDFGEGNAAGKAIRRSFRIHAMNCEDDNGNEFRITVNRCFTNRGITCSIDDLDVRFIVGPLKLTLKSGESKMVNVIWTPVECGCVREVLDLEVTHGNNVNWKQSVVIVGEAQRQDHLQREMAGGVESTNFAESNNLIEEGSTGNDNNMISGITDSNVTDSMEYSQGSTFETYITGAGEEELAMVDGSTFATLEEKKFKKESTATYNNNGDEGEELEEKLSEEESIEGPLEVVGRGVSLPGNNEKEDAQGTMTTGEFIDKMVFNGAMVSLELSEIVEVEDHDADHEDYHEEAGFHDTSLDGSLCASDSFGSSSDPLTESSEVAVLLARIDEASTQASTPATGSSSSSGGSPSSDNLGFDEMTDCISPGKPQDNGSAVEQDGCGIEMIRQNGAAVAAQEAGGDMKYGELRQEDEESLHSEDTEMELFLAEHKKARLKVAQHQEQLPVNERVDLEELLASEGLVAMEDTSVDDERSHNEPSTPSFGSLTSDDSFADESSPIESKNGVDSLVTNSPPAAAVPSLLECLTEVQEYLVNSHDEDSDADSASPSEQLILSYSIPDGDDENEESILAKMMDQASDVDSCSPDKSYLYEIRNTKSELNELIDEVSELEDVAKRHHDYITSPTNDDFNTQLDNINDGIDTITPPSLKLNPSSSKTCYEIGSNIDAVEGLRKGLNNEMPPTVPQKDTIPTATSKEAAQKCFVSNQPKNGDHARRQKNNHSSHHIMLSGEKENNGDNGQSDEQINNTLPDSTKDDTTPILSSCQKLSVLSEDNYKTRRSRSEHIASIRDKLRLVADSSDDPKQLDDAVGNKSTPQSTECKRLTPKEKLLTIDQLPNTSKNSARKCYFHNSPTPNVSRKCSSQPNSTNAKQPQSPDDGTFSRKQSNASKLSFSTPSIGTRGLRANEKHINTVREQNNKNSLVEDSPDSVKRGRSGSSPQLKTPSPRELKAYERHIRSMRDRLGNKDSTPKTDTSAQRTPASSRSESAYDRHIRRMKKGKKSHEEEP